MVYSDNVYEKGLIQFTSKYSGVLCALSFLCGWWCWAPLVTAACAGWAR